MLRRSALLVLLCLALSGCGGGGGGDAGQGGSGTPAPSASATATAEETVDAAVAAREAVAARRDAIRGEIRALRGLSPKQASDLYYKLDGLALQLGSQHFRVDTKQIDRTDRLSYKPDGSFANLDRVYQQTERQEWATLVPIWKRFTRKLAKVRTRGSIAASARDFQVTEWRRSTAVMEQFLGLLRHEKPQLTEDDYYQSRAFGQSSRFPVVIGEPATRRKALVRGLRHDLRRIGGVGEVTAKTPSVGDVYRRTIARSFMSPLKKFKRREPNVAGQLWMLYRIRELEHTPEAAYENARLTISQQSLSGARDRYGELLDIGIVLDRMFFASRTGMRYARRERDWALEMLGRPVPEILAPTRDQMVRVYEDLDLVTPPRAASVTEIFDKSDAVDRAGKHVIRILRRGAKRVDTPSKLRQAVIEALVATRPS